MIGRRCSSPRPGVHPESAGSIVHLIAKLGIAAVAALAASAAPSRAQTERVMSRPAACCAPAPQPVVTRASSSVTAPSAHTIAAPKYPLADRKDLVGRSTK
jgi:hypothetical protein